jgi:hypothetical protein
MHKIARYFLDFVLVFVAAMGWRRAFAAEREMEQQRATWRATAEGVMAELRKRRREPNAGFSAIATLLLMVGMSLPVLAMVLALHSRISPNAVIATVWLASAVGVACALTGRRFSDQKDNAHATRNDID